MIARPKISRNERKTTEIGAFEVGNFAPFCCPGPNHTLPTSGTARYTGGLCVMDFLRIRTWMRIDDGPASQGAVRDAVRLARIEGLEGHARAAEARLLPPPAKKQKL